MFKITFNFLLKQNSIIPVVTINDMDEIEPIIYSLLDKNIKCIEVTLRTSMLFEAIEFIKKSFGEKICVGWYSCEHSTN